MATPIRILHVVTYMGRGGLETLLMNCYRHIDRQQVQFDFLVHREFRADYDDEIEALGGRIYRMPRLNPFSPVYKKSLLKFFRAHPEYRIVHSHLDCMSAFPLGAAKECDVPVRIAHSHSSNQDKNWKYPLKLWYMKRIPAVATDYFACSEEAGRWMFPGQKFKTVNNGIDTSLFSFSPEKRKQMRQTLKLENSLTVGHVGRFAPPKNHDFLIDVFAGVCKQVPNAKLLLVGGGALEEAVRVKVKRLNLESNVCFLGIRNDVNDILQALDVFLLPSLYEGLGMAVVEAQTAGAKCVVSCGVPDACDLTGNVTFLSLEEDVNTWADTILSFDLADRRSWQDVVTASGYDIRTTADYLQKFYKEKW